MTGGKLTVEIGADITGLQKGIDQTEKELGKLRALKNKEIRLNIDTTGTSAKISELESKLTKLNKTSETVTTATKSMGQAASATVPQTIVLQVPGLKQPQELLNYLQRQAVVDYRVLGLLLLVLKRYDAFEANRITSGSNG